MVGFCELLTSQNQKKINDTYDDMLKNIVNNPRYPHTIRVVRVTYGEGDWLSDNQQRKEQNIYFGPGRCYSSGGSVEGKAVDITYRQISIPVRFDEWNALVPASGDCVEVTIGKIIETMTVKEFEPDNNRTVLYCERNGNLDE